MFLLYGESQFLCDAISSVHKVERKKNSNFGIHKLYLNVFFFFFFFVLNLRSSLTLLHSERPKLYAILAFLSAIGLSLRNDLKEPGP